MEKRLRVGLLGGGTIGRLVLSHAKAGNLAGIEIVAVGGRGAASRGAALAREYAIPYAADREALMAFRPDVILEAASHDAVREHLLAFLERGIGVIVLSAGALVDDSLLNAAQTAAARCGALLYVPSGGIGGLDVLKTACLAGVDSASIQVAKPPAAWRGIPYVESRGIALDDLERSIILFDGTAREGVPHFPQNVNIAAILAMGGIGWDRTRLTVVADPGLTLNTHTIRVKGRSGQFTIVLENVPAPENPKTSWLACYSAIAALKSLQSRTRFGT
jgi:aspartate dehydrogenase